VGLASRFASLQRRLQRIYTPAFTNFPNSKARRPAGARQRKSRARARNAAPKRLTARAAPRRRGRGAKADGGGGLPQGYSSRENVARPSVRRSQGAGRKTSAKGEFGITASPTWRLIIGVAPPMDGGSRRPPWGGRAGSAPSDRRAGPAKFGVSSLPILSESEARATRAADGGSESRHAFESFAAVRRVLYRIFQTGLQAAR